MSCLLPLIVGVCLASPEGLSIEGQVAEKIAGAIDYQTTAGVTNTLGRAAILMHVEVGPRFSAQWGVEHMSGILTGSDRGAEYAVIRFQYRPFARE